MVRYSCLHGIVDSSPLTNSYNRCNMFWQTDWRRIAAKLPLKGLRALRAQLRRNGKLLRGSVTEPEPGACCPIGYAFWRAGQNALDGYIRVTNNGANPRDGFVCAWDVNLITYADLECEVTREIERRECMAP